MDNFRQKLKEVQQRAKEEAKRAKEVKKAYKILKVTRKKLPKLSLYLVLYMAGKREALEKLAPLDAVGKYKHYLSQDDELYMVYKIYEACLASQSQSSGLRRL